ncbi:MAG: hypothetical protein JNL12_23460 [Planctomycetes bacterium]|nr:hypothetical protein [Planctomycetota bacterium]
MKSDPSPSTQRLRELLHEAAPDPEATVCALREARWQVAGRAALAHELAAYELRLLASHEVAQPTAPGALAEARTEWLRMRLRVLAEAPAEAAVVLDLAEVRALAMAVGEGKLAQDCANAIAAAVERVAPSPAIEQEVAERFAALATAIDEMPLLEQRTSLRCIGEAVLLLARRASCRRTERLGRRLLRAADDRELARRMEARFGARGVSAIETTNFVLLLVVLCTLVAEAALELTPGQLHVLHWIDALACTFFLLDFLVELLLHPSRGSWFLRNALTDLVPAIPSVLFLLPEVDVPTVVDGAIALRVLRLMRITWAARYVQALRPLLRSLRLLLFLVRGLDGLAARFAQLLNREFVFVPGAAEVRRPVHESDVRDLVFAALLRERELLPLLPAEARTRQSLAAAANLRGIAEQLGVDGAVRCGATAGAGAGRELPIDEAIEFLWALRPQDLGRWLRPADIASLDRVVRVLSVAPVRWLPLIRRVAVCPLPATPEERIVRLGRRIADWLESWHGRMLFFADLHGIVTGPQILDRVATALVKATQRPAVRLVLFGGLFSLPRLFGLRFGATVSTSLLVLGVICFGLLLLGHWLKRLAGQAAEAYRLTSEAHFLSHLERHKLHYEDADLAFLAARVFGEGEPAAHGVRLLRGQLDSVRTGVPVADAVAPDEIRLEANRTALLYLHYLDGAPLHGSDVQTTEQLLANTSLLNLRLSFLGFDAREKKRLRKLKLDDGSLFSGPYLWFRFITESIAVEAAKRIDGYNRYCIPTAERGLAEPAAIAAMRDWLERRRDPRGGRTPKDSDGRVQHGYQTTEFTALDFVGGDPERDRHIGALFGDEVLEVVRIDRRTMVREIFGTRPVHHLPQQDRSFNPLRFYERRLSRGRVLLAPLLLALRFLRSFGWLVGRVRRIVREVLDPELAMQRREIGQAPFAVAQRKIHRMKAPGLLEAIRLRLELDPAYAGAPAGWSSGTPFADAPEFERDLRFLHLREREASALRDQAALVRQQIEGLHAALAGLPDLATGPTSADQRAAGELAVGCAWIADRDGARTLLFAERWRSEVLAELVAQRARLPFGQRAWLWVRGRFVAHPVDRWLVRHGRGSDRHTVAALQVAWQRDLGGARELLAAWSALPAGASPAAAAIETLRTAFRRGPAIRRDLMALRAVQSLAVLDIRNYRELVFRLGDYGREGEHADAALP